MLVGYMRISQSKDLQRGALLAAGVDARHLFEDHASGAKNGWTHLACEVSKGNFSTQKVLPSVQCLRWRCARDTNCSGAASLLKLLGNACSLGRPGISPLAQS
ncbi:hypothetical protein SAMN04487769_0662 [Burkholderia sp. b14]|nr:hypothetical protein SAMN04487769_0662 [Burkholderia sp. b14]